MTRTPQQLEALARSKEHQVTQTKINIEAAIKRLKHAKPEKCDGKLTIKNLCTESGVSKQTIYRYPEYIEMLDELRRSVRFNIDTDDDLNLSQKDLKSIVRELLKEKAEIKRKYAELERRSKQEVMILNSKILNLQHLLAKSKGQTSL